MAGSNGGPKRAAQVCESTVPRPGFAKERLEGTPQGGSLSPLLSNLDRELERRGHRFVRYADDVVIHVRSERASQRVPDSVTRYVETALKLRVSEAKSAVARPARRTFLGYRIDNRGELRITAKSRVRLIGKLRQLLRGARGRSPRGTIEALNPVLRAQHMNLAGPKIRFDRLGLVSVLDTVLRLQRRL